MVSTGTYSVQPAVSVQVMITAVFCDDTLGKFKPQGSGGVFSQAVMASGTGNDDRLAYQTNMNGNVKIFITNTEYFQLTGTKTGYTGIEL